MDITTHLNDLNLKLQGKNQLCNEMYWHITAFERRLCLWERQLQQCNDAHFPNLQESQPADPFTFVGTLRELKVEFASRFADFLLYSGDLNLFGTPFNVDVGSVTQSLQMELIQLQCNELLKNKFNLDDVSWIDFYRKYLFPSGKFPNLVRHAKKLASLCGSTCVCKQLFLKMKHYKNQLRTKVTDAHLDDILLLSSTNLSPNVEVLSSNKLPTDRAIASDLMAINVLYFLLDCFG